MGCFEAKTDEEYNSGGGRRNNDNYAEDASNFEEEEFEDFKELDSKYNKFQLYFQFMKNIFL
jgi:hypothetical protein